MIYNCQVAINSVFPPCLTFQIIYISVMQFSVPVHLRLASSLKSSYHLPHNHTHMCCNCVYLLAEVSGELAQEVPTKLQCLHFTWKLLQIGVPILSPRHLKKSLLHHCLY